MPQHFNFSQWVDYFISNKNNLKHVEWSDSYHLSNIEHQIVFQSIRIFQKGESSEAKHLFKQAENFIGNHQDRSYMHALDLFIHEEHRHAFELKRFMMLHDIPVLEKHWSDTIFRRLRRLGGLEQSISVLLTAEIIAAVYYKALQQSTCSLVLQQICSQIIADEEMHIRFQSEALAQFYLKRLPFANLLILIQRRLLLEGTFYAVWKDHKLVFKKGGYSFFGFRKDCIKEFYKTVEIIHARTAIEKFDFIQLNFFPITIKS